MTFWLHIEEPLIEAFCDDCETGKPYPKLTYRQVGNDYYITVSGLKAWELDQQKGVVFQFGQSEPNSTFITFEISPFSYLYNVFHSDTVSPELKILCAKLRLYVEAAKEYMSI